MKKASTLRLSFLTGCAALALCAAHSLEAADAPPPSIEIHLDVLSHLSQPQSPTPLMPASAAEKPAGNPEQAAQTESKPHGKKTASAKHEKKTKEAHAEHKDHEKKTASVKHEKKTKEASAEAKAHKKTASAKHEKKTKEAKAEPKPQMEADNFAPPAPAEAKPPVAPEAKLPAAAEAAPPPLPEAAQPPLPPNPTASAEAPAPASPPSTPDVPKLAASDLGAKSDKSAAPKHEGMMSGITGGMTDILGGDSEKPPATPPAAPVDKVATAPAPQLASPSANAPSDKDLPPALSSLAAAPAGAPPSLAEAPPPLPPAEKSTGKMTMAANELPSAVAPSSSETGKAELPPTLDKSTASPAGTQMAQATLTPLPLPSAAAPTPAAPAPAPAAPAPAPASAPALAPVVAAPPTPAPVPDIVAPKAPGAPAAPASPVQAAESGATPDLRVPFNANETEMPLSSAAQLDALAKTLHDSPTARVNIMAYASGPDTAGIYPKRVSLARGIAVRNYLTTTKGIDIERVNVKALGNKNAGGPGDRVDLYVLK